MHDAVAKLVHLMYVDFWVFACTLALPISTKQTKTVNWDIKSMHPQAHSYHSSICFIIYH